MTHASARSGNRGEGGGDTDSKVLSAYSRDVLNENGKLLLRFVEDNKLALLNSFFCTPERWLIRRGAFSRVRMVGQWGRCSTGLR